MNENPSTFLSHSTDYVVRRRIKVVTETTSSISKTKNETVSTQQIHMYRNVCELCRNELLRFFFHVFDVVVVVVYFFFFFFRFRCRSLWWLLPIRFVLLGSLCFSLISHCQANFVQKIFAGSSIGVSRCVTLRL